MPWTARTLCMLAICAGLSACALCDPFDNDDYIGRADADLTVDGNMYRASWNIPIHRTSSFNPYSMTGRQDGWIYEWSGAPVQLVDGTFLWIDLSRVMPPVGAGAAARYLLGVDNGVGAPPHGNFMPSEDLLKPEHPILIDAPVYVARSGEDAASPVLYPGHCGNVRASIGCWAVVRISVPSDYIGPRYRKSLSYIAEPRATTRRCSDRDFLVFGSDNCAPPEDPRHQD